MPLDLIILRAIAALLVLIAFLLSWTFLDRWRTRRRLRAVIRVSLGDSGGGGGREQTARRSAPRDLAS